MITAERVREALDYNPHTGEFLWKIRPSNRVVVGRVAGCQRKDGYVLIRLDGELHLAHRLAWLHVHGTLPETVIDHKDTCPWHNWIENLRDVPQKVNLANERKPRKRNTSGYLGVSKTPAGKWVAQFGHGGYLGLFGTPEEAYEKYLSAKPEVV